MPQRAGAHANPAIVPRRRGLRLATPAQPLPAVAGSEGPHATSLARLAHLISMYAPHDGAFPLSLPGTHAIRLSRIPKEPVRATVRPGLCVVAQGAKMVMLGRETYPYDASRMIVYSVDLPVASQVVRASQDEPFLAFRLDLDAYKIAELALKVYPQGVPSSGETRGVCVGASSEAIVDAAARLIALMADPSDAALLGPLVVDEIVIRLLKSAIGPRIAQIGQKESGMQRVARAVSWVRANFAQPTTAEQLAGLAHMSVSSFHQHFKAVTSMSPRQYQKVLRLQEARRLMLSTAIDAAGAGREVGYLSPSQFSREYSRMFGNAPMKDLARLRQAGTA